MYLIPLIGDVTMFVLRGIFYPLLNKCVLAENALLRGVILAFLISTSHTTNIACVYDILSAPGLLLLYTALHRVCTTPPLVG